MAARKDKKEQVRPLTAASASASSSPSVIPLGSADEAAAASRWRSLQYLRKRRYAVWCCGCCGATVVVLGLTVLILSLTVFRVKDPTLTMNELHLDRISTEPGGPDTGSLVLVNATFIADVSIKNPNVASFRLDNSTTEFYFGGETVGVAYAPAGNVPAQRTARMNVTVDVLTDRVVRQMNLTPEEVATGAEVNLTSFTDISGRVNVLGIYKRDIEVILNCSMTLEVSATHGAIKNKSCVADAQ